MAEPTSSPVESAEPSVISDPPSQPSPDQAPESVSQEATPPEPPQQVEAAEAVREAPEVVAEAKEPQPEPAPAPEPLTEDLVRRLGELESKLKEHETREAEAAALKVAQAEQARVQLLSEEWGILDPLYLKIAPQADPNTKEGKEELRQWMVKHQTLFKKAPKLEEVKNEAQNTKKSQSRFGRVTTWGEAIRKLQGQD